MVGQVLQEVVSLPGPNGALSGELAYGWDEPRLACLLASPHPHMGGLMTNNVIRALALGLPGVGVVTLRFDYSGVGGSDGPCVYVPESMAAFWATGRAPEDPRMVDDVAHAARWLGQQSHLPLLAIGYSFGAYAAVAAAGDDLAGLILISATVSHHDCRLRTGCITPVMVIHSDNDFATPLSAIQAWIKSLHKPVVVHCISGGEHFLRGREAEVVGHCKAFAVELVAGIAMDKQP